MAVDELLVVDAPQGTRERIVAAAADLLESGGRTAVSTRAVSAAAGVQAPTIYRLFGDKRGLLEAVAVDGLARYLAQKRTRTVSDDPVADLRAGWDAHVALGLDRPALYFLLYDEHQAGSTSPAGHAAQDVLAGVVHRIAESGRLRVPERRAAQLLQAAARGTTLTLIALSEDERDPELSRAAREAVITAVSSPATEVVSAPVPADDLITAVVTLRALLPHVGSLTPSELALLDEWLTRIERPSDAPPVQH